MSKDPEFINPPCEACQAVELCQGRAATKCVRLMLRMGNWNLENFAKFWENIDYAYGMHLKLNLVYSEPCDCGSSVCDECNPGWDQEGPFHWEDEYMETYDY